MNCFTRRHFLVCAGGSAGTLGFLNVGTLPLAAQQPTDASSLEVIVWGAGPRVVLVHGSIANGPMAWREQQRLGERWRLEVPNRRGYGKSPQPIVRSDFEEDARDIAALLGNGAHLVGHSYGAIVALYTAALRPQSVRSLVINEPPAFGLLKGDGVVDAVAAAQAAAPTDAGPRVFLEALVKTQLGPGETPPPLPPDPLPPALEQGIRTTMAQRPSAEAVIPLEALKRASFPKLVISGGHSPAYILFGGLRSASTRIEY